MVGQLQLSRQHLKNPLKPTNLKKAIERQLQKKIQNSFLDKGQGCSPPGL